MEENIQNKKILGMNPRWILVGLFLFMVTLVSASVIIHSFNVTVNVSESLSSTQADVTVGGNAGETVTQNIAIHNSANVPLDVKVSYLETSNPNSVVYTDNLPKTVSVPNGDSTISINFMINSASPAGSFSGSVTMERI